MRLTKQQQLALKALWERTAPENRLSYLTFRRLVFPELAGRDPSAAMVPWAGMLIGIEPDGYTHS